MDGAITMGQLMAKNNSKSPKTAGWQVKGDGVAFTSSKAILNSQAGQTLVKQAAKVQLTKASGGNSGK